MQIWKEINGRWKKTESISFPLTDSTNLRHELVKMSRRRPYTFFLVFTMLEEALMLSLVRADVAGLIPMKKNLYQLTHFFLTQLVCAEQPPKTSDLEVRVAYIGENPCDLLELPKDSKDSKYRLAFWVNPEKS